MDPINYAPAQYSLLSLLLWSPGSIGQTSFIKGEHSSSHDQVSFVNKKESEGFWGTMRPIWY